MMPRYVWGMDVKCPRCGNEFSLGMDVSTSHLLELQTKAACRSRIAQDKARAEVEIERMKLRRKLAKESRRTCSDLSKARNIALQEISKNGEAAQRGVNISPDLIAEIQRLVDALVAAESYSGGVI